MMSKVLVATAAFAAFFAPAAFAMTMADARAMELNMEDTKCGEWHEGKGLIGDNHVDVVAEDEDECLDKCYIDDQCVGCVFKTNSEQAEKCWLQKEVEGMFEQEKMYAYHLCEEEIEELCAEED